MSKLLKSLKKYFKETPREKIQADWEAARKESEGVKSPPAEEYIKYAMQQHEEFKNQFNHNRTLESFQEQIDKIQSKGFKVIAVTQMQCEDTFVFETQDEAIRAYHTFERDENENWIGEVSGWWYGKENIEPHIEFYESEFKTKVLIYWL